jgi:NAD(P)-dependent dehydrogenase (short-subunit alcohol dehydrogenase family)
MSIVIVMAVPSLIILPCCGSQRERTHTETRGRSDRGNPIAGRKTRFDGIAADFSGPLGAEAVIAKLPAVDVLVKNVEIFEPKPFPEIPDEDSYRLFEINVMSGARLARHYVTSMLKNNWGRILFISSESAVQISR